MDKYKRIDAKDLLNKINYEDFYRRELNLTSITRPSAEGWCQAGCLCPFHSDSTPGSLSINIKHGGFTCFACGAKGSIYDFVMSRDYLNFYETLIKLDREYN